MPDQNPLGDWYSHCDACTLMNNDQFFFERSDPLPFFRRGQLLQGGEFINEHQGMIPRSMQRQNHGNASFSRCPIQNVLRDTFIPGWQILIVFGFQVVENLFLMEGDVKPAPAVTPLTIALRLHNAYRLISGAGT